MADIYKVKITVSRGKKVGRVYGPGGEGEKTLLRRKKCSTFRELSRKLRKDNLVPANVVLNKKGETTFKK